MAIKYDLCPVKLLEILGYEQQPSAKEWLESFMQDKKIPLPKVYLDFMERAFKRPLFKTDNLWTTPTFPGMFYEEIQECIEDEKENSDSFDKTSPYYKLAQLPVEQWPNKVCDYLLIGSDYANGDVTFGIRKADLEQDNPKVYWQHEEDPFTKWRDTKHTLSEFLLEVLFNILSCVNYDTAESALENIGWRREEYFDPEKDDWVASKSVLKKQGIRYPELKQYLSSNGTVFGCYDDEKNVFYVGHVDAESKEISLAAIVRAEAEHIFLDIEDLID